MLKALPKRRLPPLHDAAVNAARTHMAGHIEEPDPLPFVEDHVKVLRRVNELFGADGRIARVDGQQAAGLAEQGNAQKRAQKQFTHRTFLPESRYSRSRPNSFRC